MRFSILLLIDLLWLAAALGFLVWGSIVLLKSRGRWKLGLGFVTVGGVLMAARFIGSLWDFIHECVGS